MFTTIEIRKFRSCRNVRLTDLKEILVLIGRNGAGKTNILRAIEWVAFFVNGLPSEKTKSSFRRSAMSDGDVSLTFKIKEISYCYELKRTTDFDFKEGMLEHQIKHHVEERVFADSGNSKRMIIHRNGESVTLHRETEPEVDFEIAAGTSALFAIQALFPERSTFRILASTIQTFLSAVRYYPLHNFEEVTEEAITSGIAYQKWKSDKNQELSSLSSLLMTIIHMSEERKDSFEELNSLFGPNGMGLAEEISVVGHSFKTTQEISAAENEKNTFYFVTFKMPGKDGKTIGRTINELSFGSIRILFLLVSMLYDRASVSLVEQPEDGVHIGLVDKLIPLLRSYSLHSQFIIASHSTAVLNRSRASEIRLISYHDGQTYARGLSEMELSAAENYLKEEGSLSDFLESIGDE